MTKSLRDRTVKISTAIETATMMMKILVDRAALQQNLGQDPEVVHISVAHHHHHVAHPPHCHLHRLYQLPQQLRPQQLQLPHHSHHKHVLRPVLHRHSTPLQQFRHQLNSHWDTTST